MLRRTTLHIENDQRAFVFRFGCFQQLLKPGTHRIEESRGVRQDVETFNIHETIFRDLKTAQMIRRYPKQLGHYFSYHTLSKSEIGLIFRNEQLIDIAEPGEFRAIWKEDSNLRLNIVDVSLESRIQEDLLSQLAHGLKLENGNQLSHLYSYIEIPESHVGLVFMDNEFKELIQSGSYGYWQNENSTTIELLSTELQMAEFSQPESIFTHDDVNIGINLLTRYQVTNPERFTAILSKSSANIQPLQTLDDLFTLFVKDIIARLDLNLFLEDCNMLSKLMYQEGRIQFKQVGIELSHIQVQELILPDDIRDSLMSKHHSRERALPTISLDLKRTQLSEELLEEQPLPQDQPETLEQSEPNGSMTSSSNRIINLAANAN